MAEDLVARKITSPDHVGIEGGSQGGLLVGATFVQRAYMWALAYASLWKMLG